MQYKAKFGFLDCKKANAATNSATAATANPPAPQGKRWRVVFHVWGRSWCVGFYLKGKTPRCVGAEKEPVSPQADTIDTPDEPDDSKNKIISL